MATSMSPDLIFLWPTFTSFFLSGSGILQVTSWMCSSPTFYSPPLHPHFPIPLPDSFIRLQLYSGLGSSWCAVESETFKAGEIGRVRDHWLRDSRLTHQKRFRSHSFSHYHCWIRHRAGNSSMDKINVIYNTQKAVTQLCKLTCSISCRLYLHIHLESDLLTISTTTSWSWRSFFLT